jgi:hypothetical protein
MRPVFIGGCPRSGTTLLGAMLGGHPDYLCVPEMQFKRTILRLPSNGPHGAVDKADALQKLAGQPKFRIWELGTDVALMPHGQLSCRELIEWIVKAYGQKVGKLAPAVWVDHTPHNVKYARTLLRLFPDAKVIHIVRDGRAVAASIMPLDWGPNEIDSAARRWAKRLAYGLAAESRWPEKVIRVRYEDLVQDPPTVLQHLCEALSINYDPAMCRATGFQVPKYTAQQHALIGRAPDPARVHAWEKQLTSRQIEIFESITSELLESLGYVPKFGPHARKMSRLESLTVGIRELYKKEFVNRRRKRRRERETIPS